MWSTSRRRGDDIQGVSMGLLTAATSNAGGAFIFLVLLLLFYVLFTLPVWGTYQKAQPQGDPAWAAFVPIYQFIVLLRVAGRPKAWAWFLLLYFLGFVVPFIGFIPFFVISIIVLNDVSKSFGHGGGFTTGLVLLPIIFWFILWLGKSTYLGPKGPAAMAGSYGGYPQPGYPPPGYPQQGYPAPGYPQQGYPQPGGYPPPPPAPGAAYPQPGGYAPPPPAPGVGYPPPPQPGTAYPPPPAPPGAGMPPEAPPQPPTL